MYITVVLGDCEVDGICMHMCHWTKDGLHKHIGGWSSIHFHRDLYILKMDDIHLPNSAYLF